MLQLKKLREEAELSQKEIAKRINKSPQAYNYYELGSREPDLETLVKLADIFMVSVDTLLGHKPLGSNHGLTPSEFQLVQSYRALENNYRRSLFDYINFLGIQQEKEQSKREQAI